MASRAAQLAVELVEKGASDVAGGLDDVTSSAKRMGDTTEAAGKQAGRGLDATASGADEVASKGSQAAGAMAGLGDLIGGPFGAAMATGGVGLQAMADSGDLLNAALENSVVASARAKAGTVAKTVADKASAAATRVMTVAQKALNLAQRASPIGLIITGVLLLVGVLTLAYRHSSRFRAIVDSAMRVARAGVDKAVGAFKALGPVVQKVMQLVARVVGIYVKVYVTAFQLGFKLAKATWDGIRTAVSSAVGFITDKIGDLQRKVSGAWDVMKRAGKAAFDALTAPVQKIVDLVQSLLDKIDNIHLPNLPHIPGLGRTGSFGALPVVAGSSTPAPPVNISLTVPATPGTTSTQAYAQGQALMDAIDDRLVAVGRKAVFKR